MNELQFRITKAMFSLKQNEQVEEIDLSQIWHEFTAEEQEELLKNLRNAPAQVSNANPLFADPNLGKNKIRV
jgi:hypothetical protein